MASGNTGGIIRAELDALSSDAHGLQDISDMQAQLMHSLGGTLQGLAATLQGDQSGPALQACGDRLIHDGQQFSVRFADHAEMMSNNRTHLDTMDADNAHGFNAIQGGIRIT